MLFIGLECGPPPSGPTPLAVPQSLLGMAWSSASFWGGVHVSQPPTLAVTGEACELGNGVRTDNPATGTPAQHLRIAGGAREAGLVRLPRGGHFAVQDTWSADLCLHDEERSDKWRGRPKSEGSRRAEGRPTGSHWFPLSTLTGGCAAFVLWDLLHVVMTWSLEAALGITTCFWFSVPTINQTVIMCPCYHSIWEKSPQLININVINSINLHGIYFSLDPPQVHNETGTLSPLSGWDFTFGVETFNIKLIQPNVFTPQFFGKKQPEWNVSGLVLVLMPLVRLVLSSCSLPVSLLPENPVVSLTTLAYLLYSSLLYFFCWSCCKTFQQQLRLLQSINYLQPHSATTMPSNLYL